MATSHQNALHPWYDSSVSSLLNPGLRGLVNETLRHLFLRPFTFQSNILSLSHGVPLVLNVCLHTGSSSTISHSFGLIYSLSPQRSTTLLITQSTPVWHGCFSINRTISISKGGTHVNCIATVLICTCIAISQVNVYPDIPWHLFVVFYVFVRKTRSQQTVAVAELPR